MTVIEVYDLAYSVSSWCLIRADDQRARFLGLLSTCTHLRHGRADRQGVMVRQVLRCSATNYKRDNKSPGLSPRSHTPLAYLFASASQATSTARRDHMKTDPSSPTFRSAAPANRSQYGTTTRRQSINRPFINRTQCDIGPFVLVWRVANNITQPKQLPSTISGLCLVKCCIKSTEKCAAPFLHK